MGRMKRYKVNDEYTILSGLPYSFQISSKNVSYRIHDPKDNIEEMYPHSVVVDTGYLNPDHVLLYTPRKYMRIVWYDDPEEPNGQIDMGIHTPDSGIEFGSWLTLANGIPREVINMAYKAITAPETITAYEVPVIPVDNNLNNNNLNNHLNQPPPPPPKVNINTNKQTKKKKKYKVRQGGSRH